MSKALQAHIALIVVSLIYATTFSVAKEVMPLYLKPPAFVILRVCGALLLFTLASIFIIKEKIDKKDIPRFMILGACGVAINQSFFLKGLEQTTPINASIIMVSNPVFVLIFSAMMKNEKISIQKITGISLGVTGALLLLMFNKHFKFGSETISGDLMILINSFSWAVYVVLVKPLMLKYNAFTVVMWVFLFGLIYVLPFGFNDLKHANFTAITSPAWGNIAFIIFGGTFLAYILNTYALRALSPSAMSVYVYFQPFLTTLIAVFFYHNDTLDTRKIISGALILSGVYLVSRPFKKRE
jgi:drug/metabolite transporter (DMT)-like permease